MYLQEYLWTVAISFFYAFVFGVLMYPYGKKCPFLEYSWNKWAHPMDHLIFITFVTATLALKSKWMPMKKYK